jgi:hypothetical protein
VTSALVKYDAARRALADALANPARQVKRMSLEAIQHELRATSGTPLRPGDRACRYLLWRRLDRIIRWRERHAEGTATRDAQPGHGWTVSGDEIK